MNNQIVKLNLLILLKKLGVKFSLTHGYSHTPIQILGKLEPAEWTYTDVFITTEECNE